jgi:homoserine O-acetyltransferase
MEKLGINRWLAVIGGSMGGMQVLEWAATYPEAVYAAAPIATACAPGMVICFSCIYPARRR